MKLQKNTVLISDGITIMAPDPAASDGITQGLPEHAPPAATTTVIRTVPPATIPPRNATADAAQAQQQVQNDAQKKDKKPPKEKAKPKAAANLNPALEAAAQVADVEEVRRKSIRASRPTRRFVMSPAAMRRMHKPSPSRSRQIPPPGDAAPLKPKVADPAEPPPVAVRMGVPVHSPMTQKKAPSMAKLLAMRQKLTDFVASADGSIPRFRQVAAQIDAAASTPAAAATLTLADLFALMQSSAAASQQQSTAIQQQLAGLVARVDTIDTRSKNTETAGKTTEAALRVALAEGVQATKTARGSKPPRRPEAATHAAEDEAGPSGYGAGGQFASPDTNRLAGSMEHDKRAKYDDGEEASLRLAHELQRQEEAKLAQHAIDTAATAAVVKAAKRAAAKEAKAQLAAQVAADVAAAKEKIIALTAVIDAAIIGAPDAGDASGTDDDDEDEVPSVAATGTRTATTATAATAPLRPAPMQRQAYSSVVTNGEREAPRHQHQHSEEEGDAFIKASHDDSGGRAKVPQPAKYNGDDNVEDALFCLENYLRGNKISQRDWPAIAMPLLSGKALAVWISHAQPLQHRGVSPTWADFVRVLTQAFTQPDRKIAARTALFDIKQHGSVQEYLQRMRILITRAGDPPTSDSDLLLLFWKGLKDHVRDNAKVNPQTGKFWESFEALASHCTIIDTQRVPSHPRRPHGGFPSRQRDRDRHTLAALPMIAKPKRPRVPQARSYTSQQQQGRQTDRSTKYAAARGRDAHRQGGGGGHHGGGRSHDGSRSRDGSQGSQGGRGRGNGHYPAPPTGKCPHCGCHDGRHYAGKYACQEN